MLQKLTTAGIDPWILDYKLLIHVGTGFSLKVFQADLYG